MNKSRFELGLIGNQHPLVGVGNLEIVDEGGNDVKAMILAHIFLKDWVYQFEVKGRELTLWQRLESDWSGSYISGYRFIEAVYNVLSGLDIDIASFDFEDLIEHDQEYVWLIYRMTIKYIQP
jgi:hypothetical protein